MPALSYFCSLVDAAMLKFGSIFCWCCSLLIFVTRHVLVELLAILSTVSAILVETMNGLIGINHPQDIGWIRWLLYSAIQMNLDMTNRWSKKTSGSWGNPARCYLQTVIGVSLFLVLHYGHIAIHFSFGILYCFCFLIFLLMLHVLTLFGPQPTSLSLLPISNISYECRM